MGKNTSIPLAKGLLGSKTKSVSGQIEVTYLDYKAVQITIWRKMYTGDPDVNFTISDTDLTDLIETLTNAQKKIEEYWLSKMAKEQMGVQK